LFKVSLRRPPGDVHAALSAGPAKCSYLVRAPLVFARIPVLFLRVSLRLATAPLVFAVAPLLLATAPPVFVTFLLVTWPKPQGEAVAGGG
jgi:hypothetical protein